MIMEFKPFCPWPETLLLIFAHQSSKSKDSSATWGARSCKPNPCKMVNQTCRGKNTGDQQVLKCFFSLVAKWADDRMWKSLSGQAVSRPAFVVGNCPHKEFALARRPISPDSFPQAEIGGADEKGFISWFCRVLPGIGELPNVSVF